MLLLLALVACVAAQWPTGCTPEETWLDISSSPAVYRCPAPGTKRSFVPFVPAKVNVRSAACPFGPTPARVQDPIDTFVGWNSVQNISPIGRSVNGKPWSAQTFLSTKRQNLLTLQFAFTSTDNLPAQLQIQTFIYKWDDVNNATTGSAIWASANPMNSGNTGIAPVPLAPTFNQILYNVQDPSITLLQPPAAPITSFTVAINAALDANQQYAVVFFSPDVLNAGTGSIGARQGLTDVYPEGRYYWNGATGSSAPASGWEAANPTNDAAFKLTFSEICECLGEWIDNPFWNQVANTGSPKNCLESTCADYPAPFAAQAGFLDEAYSVKQAANLNGNLCDASYGSVTLPLTNLVQTSPVFQFYRLWSACSQSVPCVNCGPNVTSDCYRTSASNPSTACVAQKDVTWPNVPLTSFTQSTAVTPAAGNTGTPRAETRVSLTPTQCPAPTTPNCPCADCVTTWTNTTGCYAVLCGHTDGLTNQTATVVTPGSQDSTGQQLYRTCDVQVPPVPTVGFNNRTVACGDASGQFPCPQLPTE